MLSEQRAHQLPRTGTSSRRGVALPAPPSASRHSVGHFAGLHPEDQPETTGVLSRQRTARAAHRFPIEAQEDVMEEEDTDLYEDEESVALAPRSARRYQMPLSAQGSSRTLVRYHYQEIPPRSSRRSAATTVQHPVQRDTRTHEAPTRARHRRPHGLLLIGIGMLVMLLLWQGVLLVGAWWQRTQDDWHYGLPRTFQTDAVVGHHDSAAHPSHFVALNLDDEVQVIECPAGDCSHALVYLGPQVQGPGQNLVPITLSVRDVNGDGKPDLLVHVGQEQTLVWLNTGQGFRPLKPGEHITL